MCPALKWHVQSDISCYAVSPFVFCLIKRLVRAGQQIFQAGRIFRLCGSGADAYGDAALWQVAAGISAAFHRRAQRFPGLQYLRAAAGEQANEKFLAAEPNGDTFAPLHKLPDDRRNTLQTFITCKMAVCIVELLEKIDVHHHGGDGRHFVPSVVQRQTFQRTAVFHPRQFVRVRHLIQLDQMAHTDELTGMKNRRSLERLPLDDRWNEMPPVSAMMVDIDFFKQFNDTYGHLAGDECLQRIAAVIRQFMEGREGVAVRFGGEEFFICLFSCSRAQVLEAGETLRAAVERCGYPRGDLPQGCITVSIGAATTEAENAPRLEDLLSRADKALYEAKHEGRNCVAAYI